MLSRGAAWRPRAANMQHDRSGPITAPCLRNVVLQNGCQTMDIDFTADNPGRTLFHQKLHMEFGFMALLDYS
jgi:FtsP/CotA-like multicopper oxidase with cupredoxin domain